MYRSKERERERETSLLNIYLYRLYIHTQSEHRTILLSWPPKEQPCKTTTTNLSNALKICGRNERKSTGRFLRRKRRRQRFRRI